MDNGDILQGQPIAYYYNFMDTVSVHVCADILNFMRYDVGNMGIMMWKQALLYIIVG